MKFALVVLLVSVGLAGQGQEVVHMHPRLGTSIDRSPEGEAAFKRAREVCEDLWRRSDSLTTEERELLAECDDPAMESEGYYDVLGPGCSWYCGGGMDTLSASSELRPGNGIRYAAANAHDLDYGTAWVEGVPGHGIGESLVYHFPPENPRITEIIVVNGYVRSTKAWQANSRVKKLRMYVNDRVFAILELEDRRAEQMFSFEPLGYADRDDEARLRAQPWWSVKFEIMDVYPGEKYDDTAITEIYFDGIDVH